MRGRDVVTLGLRLALVGASLSLAVGCDWVQYRSDAAHSGNIFETTLDVDNVASLEQAWSVDTGPAPPSLPVTSPGGIFVVNGPNATMYEQATGAVRWGGLLDGGPVPLPRTWSAPSGDGSRVWVGFMNPLTSGGARGGFLTFDVRTGQVEELGGSGVLSAATFAGEDVWYGFGEVAPMADGSFAGVQGRLGDGRTMLSIEPPVPPGSRTGSPAVADGVVYASRSTGGFLDAFDAAAEENCSDIGSYRGCTPLWSAPVAGLPAPAVAGDTVFAATGAGVSAFETAARGPDQQPRWSAPVAGASALALDATTGTTLVVAGSADGTLVVFDDTACGTSGACAPVWQGTAGGAVSAPAIANGVVFVTSADGFVHAFALEGCGDATCAPLWSAPVPGVPGAPIVANSRVFVTSRSGELTAFELS